MKIQMSNVMMMMIIIILIIIDHSILVVSEPWQDTGLRERFAHVMFASTQ